MFFRKRREKEDALQARKKSAFKKIDKAQRATEKVNSILESNGITLEIKKSIGGHHG